MLKDSIKNAFIGVGCNSTPVTAKRLSGPALVIMPKVGGLMAVDILDSPRHTLYALPLTLDALLTYKRAKYFCDSDLEVQDGTNGVFRGQE